MDGVTAKRWRGIGAVFVLLLEPLLAIPSWVSMPALRADPAWRLWGRPRFRALVARQQ